MSWGIIGTATAPVTADISEFLAVAQQEPAPTRTRRQHPSGWEPGVDTEAGIIVHRTANPDPPEDWAEILAEFRLDPARWEVVSDSVNVRTWDAAVGDGDTARFFYFKADVRPRQTGDRADVDQLIRRISRHRYRRNRPATDAATVARVVCLADWQAGPDPDGLVDHVLRMKNAVVDLLKTDPVDALYVVGMGDMVEACWGHYEMQTFAVKLDRRQQVKLVRRLLVDLLTEWARHVDRVVVGAVPGNHGENRRGGKAATTFEDNDDLAVFEQAAEVLAANPDAYSHVRFVLPDGDMALTLDIAGTVVGFIHGHQARRGGATPRQKIETWWKGKQHAQHPIGDADILVSGHYHHAVLVEDGPRTWMQCPALALSRWWTEQGGAETKMGTLTFQVNDGGWFGYELIR